MSDILDIKSQKISFSQNATRISLSKKILHKLGITPEDCDIEVTYTSESIIIKKKEKKMNNSDNLFLFDLSLKEKQFLFFLVRIIKEEDPKGKIYSFNFKQINKILDCNSYESLSEIGKNNFLSILYPNKTFEKIFIFNSIGLIQKNQNNQIELSFGDSATQFFKSLNSTFPENYVDNILKLENQYSVELYLKSEFNISKGNFSFDIEDLRKIFSINSRKNLNMANLIENCINDINNNTDISISFKSIKNDKNSITYTCNIKRKNK